MPEVERPEFRKDAKQAERSLKGKGDSAGRGIARIWKGWCDNPSVLTAEKFGE